jgi:chromosome segregation ATPase
MDFNYLIAPLVTVIGIIATILTITSSNRSVRADMAEMRTEIKGDIAELRTELKGDIAELKTELRTEFRSEIGRLDKRMDNLDDRIYGLTLTMVGMRQDFNRAITPHTAMRSNDLAAA